MSAQAAGLGVEWREASRLRACSGVGLEGSLLDDPLCCPAIARGSTVGCLPWGVPMSSLVPIVTVSGRSVLSRKVRQSLYSNWNPSSLPAARSKVTVDSQPPNRFVDPRRQSAKSAFPF